MSLAVDALLAQEVELTDDQLAELDDRMAALDRGEGVRIDHVDAWLDSFSS